MPQIARRMLWVGLTAALYCGWLPPLTPKEDLQLVDLLQDEYVSMDDFLDRITRLEDVLVARGDTRAVFAAMYRVLTAKALAYMEAGFFEDREWTERFVVAFGNLYRQAFLDYETGRGDAIPQAWRIAFDSRDAGGVTVFQHAWLGIHAHINHDLPFALAEVTPYYERAERRDDFERTNEYLISSVDDVEEVLATEFDPSLGRLDAELGTLDETLLRTTLSQWRHRAWRHAALFDGSRSPREQTVSAALLDDITGRRARRILGQ